MVAAWASFVVRFRWGVLLASLLVIAALVAAERQFGGQFSNTFDLPGSESQAAFELLEARFARQAGSDAQLVFHREAGFDDPGTREAIAELIAAIRDVPQVNFVTSPFEQGGAVSAEGRTALGSIRFSELPSAVEEGNAAAVLALAEAARRPDLQIELGGQVIARLQEEPPGVAEAAGLAAAAVVLLIAFGSVVAMGLPILTALAGLASSLMIIGLLSRVLDITTFAPNFAAMIGIGVGIDYALFVVTRFREGLAEGLDVPRAVTVAVQTAGRAVAFAAAVVVVALLGLAAIGIPLVTNLGLAGGVVVAMAGLVALSLLPALLAILGRRVDRLAIPALRSAGAGDPRSAWYRFSRAVQRRPLLIGTLAVGLLLALAAPLVDMELGVSDEGNNPRSDTTRRAYDLLADAFGPGFNGPLLVVAERPGGLPANSGRRIVAALAREANIAQVGAPIANEAGDTLVLNVIPGSAPQATETRDLVNRLRRELLPGALAGTGTQAFVAGATAAGVDISARVTDRLIPFFALVLGLSFLLLMSAFRSILVPLKAAVMNLLAISAAGGVVVAIFQWGWLGGLIGVERTGPIESFLPMFMFAILFGLSMDYEVFLLSRIRERFLQRRDPAESVAYGISASGRVITAAAAILVAVFLAFALGDQRVIREFGIGMATAIFLDATIVRMVLVPATMQLLGQANWWMPRWLDRALPTISIDPPPVRLALPAPRLLPPRLAGPPSLALAAGQKPAPPPSPIPVAAPLHATATRRPADVWAWGALGAAAGVLAAALLRRLRSRREPRT